MATKKKKKKKGGMLNKILTLGIIVCVLVMGYSVYRLLGAAFEYKEGEREYDNLKKYTAEIKTDTDKSDSVVSGSLEAIKAENVAVAPIKVDFDGLKAINPDIVGWLYIEALPDISYPIVRGEDNDYYLHRTFEGKDNFAGSIFMEYRNNRDFNDGNTILYGHNMKNQSMFGQLKFLKEWNKYMDSRYFWILTPEGDYRYEIFSMQITGAESDVYTLFTNPGQEFIDYLNKRSGESEVPLSQPEFSTDSKVVTLSTCTSDESSRFVVQGIRVNN